MWRHQQPHQQHQQHQENHMSDTTKSPMVGRYCIIRTYSAGVHAGTVSHHCGKEVLLRDSRRLWYWAGAASLSQLAAEGVKCPEQCKFTTRVNEILLTEAIEIIPCTEDAEANIAAVPEWKV
jgi:hypothetical protein